MAKFLLPILLVLVSGAYCQNSTSTTSVMPEPTSTASIQPTSTVVVLPTTAPNFGYTYSKSGKVCIKMNASLGLNVSYTNKNEKKNRVILNVAEPADVNETASYCNRSVSGQKGIVTSELVLQWGYGGDNYTLSFHLKGNFNSGKEQWNVTSVNATIPVAGNDDLPDTVDSTKNVTAGYGDLVESLDFTRSYFCNASRLLNMTVFNGAGQYVVFLNITEFQIQAFEFSNTTSYEYGNAVRCSQDIKGSKIVPIIVGAALAGLVIIVLIAYIIGRYRSRKQNSYEALS